MEKTNMRLPLQSAPVNRTLGAAALTGDGVEASFDWGSLAKTVANVVGQAAPVIAGLL